jgi:hypothetical protein
MAIVEEPLNKQNRPFVPAGSAFSPSLERDFELKTGNFGKTARGPGNL